MEDTVRSVRRAFASERLQNSWKLLTATAVHDREAALGGVERLLAKNGLTMDEVLVAILSLPDPGPPAGPVSTPTDLFPETIKPASVREENFSAARAACPDSLPKISGKSIPHHIGGRICLQSERTVKGNPEITVSVTGSDTRYEPLKARDERVISILRQAAEKKILTQLTVQPVKTSRQIPLIVSAGMGIDF